MIHGALCPVLSAVSKAEASVVFRARALDTKGGLSEASWGRAKHWVKATQGLSRKVSGKQTRREKLLKHARQGVRVFLLERTG